MIVNEEDLDDYLAHYGVKGMHWGQRKARETSGEPKASRFTPEQKARAKQVAIGTGVLLAAAGAAYVAHQMHGKIDIPVSSIKPPSNSTKKAVDKVLREQVDVIHSSRGQHVGFRFIKTGGLPDPLDTFEKAFGGAGHDADSELFRRLSDGKIAAGFADPQGRKDFAGRVIPHQIIVPKSMTDGLSNLDDVKAKIWPLLKDTYDEVYNLPSSVERNNR